MNAVITAKRTVTTGAWASGTILYSWKQQVPKLLTGAFEDPLSFRSGTVTSDTVWESPAVELNNADVAVGTNVFLRQRGYVLGVMTYEFSQPAAAAAALVYDCKNLPSIVISSGSNGTWYTYGTDTTTVSSGDELVVPSAGKYEIKLVTHVAGMTNTGAPGQFLFRIWDSVGAAAILAGDNHLGSTAAAAFIGATFGANNVEVENVVSYNCFAILAGTERLSVQMKRDTGTWWFSQSGALSGTNYPLLSILKVG